MNPGISIRIRSVMIHLTQCLLLGCIALPSCSVLRGKKELVDPSQIGPSGVPPHLRAKTPGGTATTPDGTMPSGALITPEEDIVFTNPDNPDSSLPELATLLESAPGRRASWEESESIAKRRAAREGKPVLIWFTDSKTSPMCKAISQELFSTPDFEKWADEKLIRLRVDANVRENPLIKGTGVGIEDAMSREVDLSRYVARLKKQYKVLGYPSVLMLNPAGEVIGRYRGYKRGDADYFWGLIKQGEAVSANSHKAWKAGLEKKGYRDWKDRKGRQVFARLLAYSNGWLSLIEPDGTRSRTHEDKLSDEDQQWIRDQKKLRNLK